MMVVILITIWLIYFVSLTRLRLWERYSKKVVEYNPYVLENICRFLGPGCVMLVHILLQVITVGLLLYRKGF